MKTIITLLLSCVSVLAADTDICVVRISGTNVEDGVAHTKHFCTRDGQTNLVCTTKVAPRGVLRVCQFYHAGRLVGNFVGLPQESVFNTEAGLYCMSLKYGPTGEIRSARIGDKQGELLDEFTYTNGTFSPVEGPLKRNGFMKPKFGEFAATRRGGPTSQ